MRNEAHPLPRLGTAPETREITLLFCDIAGMTEFTEQRGDFAAYQIVKICQSLVTELARRAGGELLEVRGDGFLLVFEAPFPATRCAIEIQRAIAHDTELPISMRIGLHTGEALHDSRGYYGGTVIAAFRMSSLAQADEILISDVTRARLPGPTFAMGESRDVRLKGFGRDFRLWSLRWRDAQPAIRSRVSSGSTPRFSRVGSSGIETGAASR